MKSLIIIILTFVLINPVLAGQKSSAYFAGGCFWCMEESFEKLNGVDDVISGSVSYTHLTLPTILRV